MEDFIVRNLDLSPLMRSTIGFDQLDKLLEAAFREGARDSSYPPYNIVKLGSGRYRITMAVAGFAPEELEITVQDHVLTVRGRVNRREEGVEYLHKGIAQRAFEHRFQLADHVRVVGAQFENGLLHIDLERVVPEEVKPRRIEIRTGS